VTSQVNAAGTFTLPGTGITLNRMGYGAMQLAGPHVWGPPKNVDEAERSTISFNRKLVIRFCSSLSKAATTRTLMGIRSSARNETAKSLSVETASTAAHWMGFFIYSSTGKFYLTTYSRNYAVRGRSPDLGRTLSRSGVRSLVRAQLSEG
jgi:hypothetical protein